MIASLLRGTRTMHVSRTLASGALSHLGQGHEPSMKQRPPAPPSQQSRAYRPLDDARRGCACRLAIRGAALRTDR